MRILQMRLKETVPRIADSCTEKHITSNSDMKKKLALAFMASAVVLLAPAQNTGSKPQNPGMNSLAGQTLFEKSMKEGVSCYRIPSIVTAANGDLVAAIDERVLSCGDLKWNRDINIVVRRSHDNGKTWTGIETVVDFPLGQSASDPSMVVDKETGEIFLFYNYMDLDKEKDVYYFHVVSSRDNGKTWSQPRDITSSLSTDDMKPDFKFITSGRGTCTSDGKLLHTIVNLKKGLYVFGSDDHGKTWYFIDHPLTPGDESKIIELPDGRWMVSSRVNKAGLRYAHVSDDQGHTWTTRPDSTLTDPGCNGSILTYSSRRQGDDRDRVILSHLADPKDRRNLVVRLSYDNGQTWPYCKTICAGSAAYSSLTVLDNGDIAIFYEKDDYQKNEFAVFTLDWLTDGQDTFRKPTQRN